MSAALLHPPNSSMLRYVCNSARRGEICNRAATSLAEYPTASNHNTSHCRAVRGVGADCDPPSARCDAWPSARCGSQWRRAHISPAIQVGEIPSSTYWTVVQAGLAFRQILRRAGNIGDWKKVWEMGYDHWSVMRIRRTDCQPLSSWWKRVFVVACSRWL
jgi:hypothetical protein